MTEERLVLAELLEKAGDDDFLRAAAEAVLQLLMESDVEGMIGAGRYERNGDRTTWRNGYRDRTLDTRLGALQLPISKLRQGSYFPPFLEARENSENALIAASRRPGNLPPGRSAGSISIGSAVPSSSRRGGACESAGAPIPLQRAASSLAAPGAGGS
jgi:hypothetical protein